MRHEEPCHHIHGCEYRTLEEFISLLEDLSVGDLECLERIFSEDSDDEEDKHLRAIRQVLKQKG